LGRTDFTAEIGLAGFAEFAFFAFGGVEGYDVVAGFDGGYAFAD